jgi:hypothetical protein
MTTKEMTRADELLADIERDHEGSIVPYDPRTGEIIPDPPPAPVVQANPYIGIAAAPFPPESIEVLLAPIPDDDVEIRPDGLIYLPEIKYRRILSRAFGPGAWALLPMEITVNPTDNMLYYKGALFVRGQFVSEAIGEQQYYPENGNMSYATAAESAKSNCLLRCCKDLSVASELWDPTFVKRWVATYAVEVWCVNVGSRDKGKKKKMWRKKSDRPIDAFPWKEDNGFGDDGNSPSVRQDAPIFRDEPGTPRPAAKPATGTHRSETTTTAAPAAPASAPASSGGGNAGGIVSPKQVNRFRAIARSNGWTEAEQTWLLGKFGFDVAEKITRDAYERICTALENPVILTEVRAEMDQVTDDGLPF